MHVGLKDQIKRSVKVFDSQVGSGESVGVSADTLFSVESFLH